jgi:Mce-associated membrane protein
MLRSRRAAMTGAAIVLMAALAVAGVLAARHHERQQAAGARNEAAAAARQAILNFTEIDPKALDAGLDRVTAGATGDFKAEYSRDRATLRKAYADNKLQARGEVLDSGVVAADRDSATVLLAVDQTVRRGAAGQPQLRHYRIQVEMARERGRWLVASLAFVS